MVLSRVFAVVMLSFISFGVLSEIDTPSTYTLNAWNAPLLKIGRRKGFMKFSVEMIVNRAELIKFSLPFKCQILFLFCALSFR